MPYEPEQNREAEPRNGGRCSDPPRSLDAVTEQVVPGRVELVAATEADASSRAGRPPWDPGASAPRAALRVKAFRLERQGEMREAARAFESLAQLVRGSRSDLAEGIDAGTRVLDLEPTSAMRSSLAQWLAECGHWRTAATVLLLDKTRDPGNAGLLRRIARFAALGQDAELAAAQLTEVARLEPEATDVLVAIGVLSQWAPTEVSHERGILAWHEAARRFRSRGAELQAFEAVMRAFELAPGSSLAAERLARELEVQGRREAADEVWRRCADVCRDDTVHDIRVAAAIHQGDIVAALAALLDRRKDLCFDERGLARGIDQLLAPRSSAAQGFEQVLAELGCADWLAVRLELGPVLERWSEEATLEVALGRLETGYFAHLEQARQAYLRAIVAQPLHSEARECLLGLEPDADVADALYRALAQAARRMQDGGQARRLASDIVDRCALQGGPAALALWAAERLGDASQSGEAPLLRGFRDAASADRARIAALNEALSRAEGDDAVAVLIRLEALLAFEPDEAVEHLATVHRLVELRPRESIWGARFLDLLDVLGRMKFVERDERLGAAVQDAPRLLRERGAIAAARFHLHQGSLSSALQVLRPLLDDPQTTIRGLLWVFTLARRGDELALSARAAERVAPNFRPAVRAVIEALAAQLYHDAGNYAEAERLVYATARTSQTLARLVTLQVTLAEYREPPTSLDSLEEALRRVTPTAAMCRILAKSHRLAMEFEMAYLWAQRAVALRPGDVESWRELVQLAVQLGDVERVVERIESLMNLALPVKSWDDIAASALAWIASVDVVVALKLARQLLDSAGPTSRSLRAALLDTARLAQAEEFALEILERSAASTISRSERATLELALGERYWARGTVESALRAAEAAWLSGAAPANWLVDACAEIPGESGDARLLRLTLRWRFALEAGVPESIRRATSELAFARIELSQDTEGAMELWTQWAEQSYSGGWPVVAKDMVSVLGPRLASTRLEAIAWQETSKERRGSLLLLAASVSEEAGELDKASERLLAASAMSPGDGGLLPLAERLLAEDVQRLEAVYGNVETGVLGVFGTRALHHRAARVLSSKEVLGAALAHAIIAFEALPDYEDSFLLLAELARRAHEPNALVASVMRVVDVTSDPERVEYWLGRAYAALGSEGDSLRHRFELALRRLLGCPTARALGAVSDCLQRLENQGVDDSDSLRQRFERALEALIGKLEGPDGARLGIAITRYCALELNRPELAYPALLGALKADADLEEFATLRPAVVALAQANRSGMVSTLTQAEDWLGRPFVAIGQAAGEILATMAVLLVDEPRLLRLEERLVRLGHAEWFAGWLSEPEQSLWSQLEEPRQLAVELSRRAFERDDILQAMAILECAVKVVSRDEQNGSKSNRGAATWQAWQELYGACLVRFVNMAGLSEARERLSNLEKYLPTASLGSLRVVLERESGDERALSMALAELAFAGAGSAQDRALWLFEAAQIAERLGDLDGAVVYYRAAIGTARPMTQARLALATMLYRMGRYRSREQATLALDVLSEIEATTTDDEREVQAFLSVEALEAVGQLEQAARLLGDAVGQLGPRTLICLKLAEQATRNHDLVLAVGHFKTALRGELHGLRNPAEVALSAAGVAAESGDLSLASEWIEFCLGDPLTRSLALHLQTELREAYVEQGTRVVEAESVSASIRPMYSVVTPSEKPLSEPSRPEASWAAQAMPARIGEPGAGVLEIGAPEDSVPAWDAEGSYVAEPPNLLETIAAPKSVMGEPRGAVVTSLEPTVYEQALAIAEALAVEPEQQRAWFADGRRWVRQWPAGVRLLELVRDAAEAEGHSSHVRALEQAIGVLCCDDTADCAPELVEQVVDVDALRSLLLRDLTSRTTEALELVWDGAEHEFQREPSEYEITGLMRVTGSASPLSRIYGEVARHFGMTRTPMFHRRTQQENRVSILLVAPTAVLIEGEPPVDERVLGYRLGSALWATQPAFSLLFGLGEATVRQVLKALELAFGTDGEQPDRTYGEALRLAQVLWQSVKSRSQRRLKAVCRAELAYDEGYVFASRSLRRAGLYVAADLRTAVACWCEDAGLLEVPATPDALRELIVSSPDLLDLLRFATSSEYADVRWRAGRGLPAGLGARPW